MVHFENAVDDKNLKLVKMINQIYHLDEIFSYVLEIINASFLYLATLRYLKFDSRAYNVQIKILLAK